MSSLGNNTFNRTAISQLKGWFANSYPATYFSTGETVDKHILYENILIKARTNDAEMSSEDQGNTENRNKARKSQEDKELEALDVESTAGGKGGGGG